MAPCVALLLTHLLLLPTVPGQRATTNVTNGTKQLLRIAGSSTVAPLALAWAQSLVETTSVQVEGGGSLAGARRLCLDRNDSQHVDVSSMSMTWPVDIAVPLDDTYTFQCVNSENRVSQLILGIDGLAVVVAKDKVAHRCLTSPSLGGLTLAQLRWMFTNYSDTMLQEDGLDMASVVPYDDHDNLREWSDLAPECANVTLNMYGSGTMSGEFELFGSQLFCPDCPPGATKSPRPEGFHFCPAETLQAYMSASNVTLPGVIRDTWDKSCYIGSENDYHVVDWIMADGTGIAYVGMEYYTMFSDKLAVIPIASDHKRGVGDTLDALVIPTVENITDGSYDVFSRNLYLNVDNAVWPAAKPFLDMAFSERGQHGLGNLGIVRLNRALLAKMLQRIADEGNENARPITTVAPYWVGLPAPAALPELEPVHPKEVPVDKILGASLGCTLAASLLFACVLRWRIRHAASAAESAAALRKREDSPPRAAVAALCLLPALCDDLVHLSEDLRVIMPCTKLANMLLEPSGSLAGRLFPDLMCPSDAARFVSHIQSAAKQPEGSMAPSLNVHLRGGGGTCIGVELFVSLWRDQSGQVSYVIGVCQINETILAVSTARGPPIPPLHQRRVLPSSASSTELWCGDSAMSDATNITNVFGPIHVVFDALAGDLRIMHGSRAFEAFCDKACTGLSLLDLVAERRTFLLFVQGTVNDYLQTKDVEMAFRTPFRLTLRAPNRRPLNVACTLRPCDGAGLSPGADSPPVPAGEAEEEETLPLCAVLTQPQWGCSGRIESKGSCSMSQETLGSPREGVQEEVEAGRISL